MVTKHIRLRLAAVAAGGAAVLALGASTPAFAIGADVRVTTGAGGDIITVSCSTPTPAGAETAPTVTSGGVTVPQVNIPVVQVPSVTINQISVGPESVGPFTVGGFPVGGGSIGGFTVGQASQNDIVAGVGATNCAALDVSHPGSATVLSGSISLKLYVEEVNPTTGAVGFVLWASAVPAPLAVTPTTIGVDVATGQQVNDFNNVPAAGHLDSASGNISTGLAQFYVGVPLAVNGVAQPNGVGCQAGDFSCNESAAFPVF